jgi:hypothetical protein
MGLQDSSQSINHFEYYLIWQNMALDPDRENGAEDGQGEDRYWTSPSSSPHANFFDGEDDTRSAPDKRSGKERDQTKPRSTLRGPA